MLVTRWQDGYKKLQDATRWLQDGLKETGSSIQGLGSFQDSEQLTLYSGLSNRITEKNRIILAT
jgi:hypothetical protein